MLKLWKTARKAPRPRARGTYPAFKRLLDIFFAAVGLLLSAPLMFCIALGIRASSPGPVFFRQVRMGEACRPFLLYKFRTMTCAAPHDCATSALPEPRRYITRFGAFLRATSLDELPQLFNILRGDMSLVGPRPVILAEWELIRSRVAEGAYTVKPGLSGLSQILGRDLLGVREKAVLDGLYARRMSFGSDAAILAKTAVCVLTRRGVREGNHFEKP